MAAHVGLRRFGLGKLIRYIVTVLALVTIVSDKVSGKFVDDRLRRVFGRITGYKPAGDVHNFHDTLQFLKRWDYKAPAEVIEILSPLDSGKVPYNSIFEIARFYASQITEEKFGELPRKAEDRAAWAAYQKALLYHIVDALTLPAEVEIR
uniref:Uncharacterized protein n=1 Tax=Babesia bovis TaxID=5865 RepID=S6BA55_BABBO|nr:hypothetical protein [Babesia bovis]BAN66111.1 hypothetical protein [Babesia bovis]|eukprot:GEMP01118431.1.p1 GENE.GEMP01118431.1~~GEMP01118431.1.p1  ORF type:complete len:163 (+),score=9.09 GEMP01118431.1:41-490(+)